MACAQWEGFRMAAESGAYGVSCYGCPMLGLAHHPTGNWPIGDQLRWQRRRMQLRSWKRALGVNPALQILIFLLTLQLWECIEYIELSDYSI